MPGAQAEEPPADEERSEPVQVGGGAFLGRDDLEEVSDEEVDWSNDEENLMIVETVSSRMKEKSLRGPQFLKDLDIEVLW